MKTVLCEDFAPSFTPRVGASGAKAFFVDPGAAAVRTGTNVAGSVYSPRFSGFALPSVRHANGRRYRHRHAHETCPSKGSGFGEHETSMKLTRYNGHY